MRKTGEHKKSRELLDDILRRDPLNHYAAYEKYLIEQEQGNKTASQAAKELLLTTMRGQPESFLELAIELLKSHLVKEAKNVASDCHRIELQHVEIPTLQSTIIWLTLTIA